MNFKTIVIIVAIASASLFFYRRANDPHRTPLPFGTTDLSSVQKPLAKLPPNERPLVEAYVKRSRGDVLPPQFADRDEPLTARTFGEAIELQRAWDVKMKAAGARAAQLQAERDATLAPLRAKVDATILEARIVTRNEYQASIDPGFYQRAYRVDTTPTFMTRIRVQNLDRDTIVAMRGSLHARDSEAYLTMDICWIDLGSQQEIPTGGHIDITCGNVHSAATTQQEDFVNKPEGRFRVEWEPRYVKFSSGEVLDSGL